MCCYFLIPAFVNGLADQFIGVGVRQDEFTNGV
jgi:hypothetical protein